MLKLRLGAVALILMNISTAFARSSCADIHLLQEFMARRAAAQQAAAQQVSRPAAESEALSNARREFAELRDIVEGKARFEGPREETLDSYIALAEKRERELGIVRGELVDTKQQDEASRTWKTVKGPRMIQDLLPEGVGLVSHTLRDAMSPGVVKADLSGGFVTLRVSLPIQRANGEVIVVSTNIGVHVNALLGNAGKPLSERKLVSDDMEWVAISNHGVGSKGTGHHVEIEKIHYFYGHRVGLIGLDSPWHGQGSTKIVTPQEEFQFVAKFLETYVPKRILDAKRVAYGGHSGGGQRGFAAMMNPGALEKYVGFYFPLSPGMDVAPGRGLREKELEHERRTKLAEQENERRIKEGLEPLLSASDRDLSRSMIAGDKLSQTAMFGYYLFTAGSDYAGGRKSKVPTLFVDGKADALVRVGFEDLRDGFVRDNPNVINLVMGERVDVKGKKAVTGHLVQDNKRPLEMPPEYNAHPWLKESFDKIKPTETEVYGLMRVLMEKIGGVKLEPLPPTTAQAGARSRLTSTFINNLAFREFAQHYVHYKYVAGPKGEQAQKINEIVSGFIKKIDKIEANKGATAEQKSEEVQKIISEEIPAMIEQRIASIKADAKVDEAAKTKEIHALREAGQSLLQLKTVAELKAKFEEAFGIMTHTFVPQGPLRAEVEANLALRKELDTFRRVTGDRKDKVLARLGGGPRKKFQDDLIVELTQISGKDVVRTDDKGVVTVQGLLEMKTEADKQVRLALAQIEKTGGVGLPANYLAAKQKATEAFQRAAQNRDEFERLASEYIFELQEKNAIAWENIVNVPAHVRQAMEAYSAGVKEYRERQLEVAQLMESEGITGSMGPEVQSLLVRQKRVREAVDQYLKESNDLEYTLHRVMVQGNLLKKDYIERLVPGNSTVVITRLAEVLDKPESEWSNYIGVLEPAWNRWRTLWGERPPPEKIELY